MSSFLLLLAIYGQLLYNLEHQQYFLHVNFSVAVYRYGTQGLCDQRRGEVAR